MIDFSTVLFRCSSLGYIMTEPRNKNELLSETCKSHLIEIYIYGKYGRKAEVVNKYIQKGLMVEEDSITLYSRVKKKFFAKNEELLSNVFIKGTPDLIINSSDDKAREVIDIKSSWDIFSFFKVHTQILNRHYYWQLQGYMALSGAHKSTLAYCLVNTPETTIMDEKRKLLHKMNVATDENELYKEACIELEKAMVYDDIPIHERVIELHIERNDKDIELMYKRIEACRTYLSELQNKLYDVQPFCKSPIEQGIIIDTVNAKKKNKKIADEQTSLCIN